MIYRPFGNTGIRLSAIGYGTNRLNPSDLQDEDGWNRSAAVIADAVNKHGINYIDCGHTYAMGKAEEIVSKAVPLFENPVHLCVKAMYVEDSDEESAYHRILASIQAYGVKKVSFGFLWKVSSYDEFMEALKPGATLDALYKAKENNLIEHICVSLHTNEEEAIRILSSGRFEGCIISCNAMNMEAYRRLFRFAVDNGIGIMTMNSLGGGMLAGNMPEIRDELSRIDDRYSAVQNAFRALYSNTAISCMLSSMPDIDQVRENCEPFIHDNGESVAVRSLSKAKYCTRCRYCMRGCPKQIQISDLMYAYSCHFLTKALGKGYGGVISEEDGLNDENESEKDIASEIFNSRFLDYDAIPDTIENPCVKCGKCNEICTQSLDVMGTIQKIYDISANYHFSHEQRRMRLREILFGKKYDKIGIFPAGKYSYYVVDAIEQYFGKANFDIVFYDNDSSKWGKMLHGHLCQPPDRLDESDMVLITSYNYGEAIHKQLSHMASEGTEIVKLHDTDRDIAWF